MQNTSHAVRSETTMDLEKAVGAADEAFEAIVEMDPEIAKAFAQLSAAAERRHTLDPKHRALIKLALSASPTHLKSHFTRLHMQEALRLGATREEICEVLELISVLGIHGFIPGTFVVLDVFGGIDEIRRQLGPQAEVKAERAKQAFMKARGGTVGDVWETSCLLAPEFVSAYAGYSGVPWKTTALPAKIKELIYVAIDLSPTHVDVGGATHHMKLAVSQFGATLDDVMEVLEIIGLFGFQTHIMALPILKEELAKIQDCVCTQ